MKIAICDDEIQFLDDICILFKKWGKKHGIKLTLYRFTNGDDMLLALQNECIDLIFLDVVMPLLNGIDTAKEVRSNNQMIPIIFLTSSREFAVDSYEVKAFNYLLKPITEEKLFTVLDEFLKTFEKLKESFIVKTSLGFCKINVADVVYLEAQNKHVIIYLSNDSTIEVREGFSKCEEFFSRKKGFFKCHRSYIVNLNHVEKFTKTQINTTNNASIPISRNNYVAFKEVYFNHMFE